MTRPAFPIWVYFAVAMLIALVAFGIAQVAEGFGMPFVLIATFAWMTFSISRQRKVRETCASTQAEGKPR